MLLLETWNYIYDSYLTASEHADLGENRNIDI